MIQKSSGTSPVLTEEKTDNININRLHYRCIYIEVLVTVTVSQVHWFSHISKIPIVHVDKEGFL